MVHMLYLCKLQPLCGMCCIWLFAAARPVSGCVVWLSIAAVLCREQNVKVARTAVVGRDSAIGAGSSVDEGSQVRPAAFMSHT